MCDHFPGYRMGGWYFIDVKPKPSLGDNVHGNSEYDPRHYKGNAQPQSLHPATC